MTNICTHSKALCSFSEEKEVCSFCRTKLRGVEVSLQADKAENTEFGGKAFKEKRKAERIEIFLTV
jgi:hypothetical protein